MTEQCLSNCIFLLSAAESWFTVIHGTTQGGWAQMNMTKAGAYEHDKWPTDK